MRRLLSDLMTPERFVHATRHALTSAQISSGGQKFGQKFSPAERTLARRPTRLLLSVEASSFSAAGRRGSGCVTRAGRAQTLRARPFPERAKSAGIVVPETNAVATRSAIGGPCLSPWPDP